jgi:uncharacterized protein DUF6152
MSYKETFEMARKLSFALGIVAVLAMVDATLLAHHGGAAFDQTKTQTLQGTVTQLDFVNPHVVVWFDVANPDGTTTKWSGWLTALTSCSARAGLSTRSILGIRSRSSAINRRMAALCCRSGVLPVPMAQTCQPLRTIRKSWSFEE